MGTINIDFHCVFDFYVYHEIINQFACLDIVIGVRCYDTVVDTFVNTTTTNITTTTATQQSFLNFKYKFIN